MERLSNKAKNLILLGALTVIALIAITIFLIYKHYHPSTKDAYVGANTVHVAAQVSGPAQKVKAQNYQMVHKGDLLLTIDPRPFKIQLQKAQAQLAQARQNIQAEKAQIAIAKAQVKQQKAELEWAKTHAQRINELVKKGRISKQKGDKVTSKRLEAEAALVAAKNKLDKAKAQLGPHSKDRAQLQQAKAKIHQAQLKLSYTHITAPTDGQLINFSVRPGTMVRKGKPLFDVVSDNKWWVDANFKETQLTNLHVGQTAKVTLDMYPDQTLNGHIESISQGSGSAFSIMPPENATGNWVKVTKRFPVRIHLDAKDFPRQLRVGASANVTVNINSSSS